ncbi:MAG: transglutaminase domain-containing protein [Litorilinea sp.]
MATISPTYSPDATTQNGSPFDPERARDRYADNIYFQDGAVFTGILTALLYLILATSLDAAGYVQNMTLLVPVVFGALSLAFFMAYSRFDGFFALSHSLFTCLAWILYLTSTIVTPAEIRPFLDNGIPELQAKAYFVLLRWLNWIDAAINGVASEDNYIFIFEMAFLVWWLSYLGVWSIFRYGYTWRAVIPAGAILLINVFYAPTSILGFLVVFCLLAILLFVRTHLAEQQLRWREQRIYYSQDITLDFLRNGLMYAVVVLALAWIAPGLGRSLQVRTVLAPVNERWEAATERWSQLYQGVNRQLQPGGAGFGRSLSLGGERNVGNSFVFSVFSPVGRYWRAVVYDTYSGRQWLNTYEMEVDLDAGQSAPIANWSMRSPITQTVTLLAPSGNVVFSAPDIVRVDVPISAVVNPITQFGDSSTPADMNGDTNGDTEGAGTWGGPVEVTWARTRQMMEAGESYRVVSNYAQTTVRALESASTDYPAGLLEAYTQLPEDFSPRVAAHAVELTAEHATVYAKAKAVETFLRTYTYNDIIAAPPADVDPVEYFLYDIQEGYCDYYATSMAVMLRSVGIPARVVSGYAQGVLDEETGQYFISERDAHTWVEVYFPEYGWIEFEPTAGESPLDRPAGDDPTNTDILSDPQLSDFNDEFMPNDDFPEELNNEPVPEWQDENLLGDELSAQDQQNRLLWALLTPLLLVIGVWFIWRMRVQGPNQFDPDLPSILYERLQSWAERLGFRNEPTHTPYEQADRFGYALPEARPAIDSITQSYVQFRFRRPLAAAQAAPSGAQEVASASIPVADQPTDAQFAETAQAQTHNTESGVTTGPLNVWEELQPILWRAWMRKIFRLDRQSNPTDKRRGRVSQDFTLESTADNAQGASASDDADTALFRPRYTNGKGDTRPNGPRSAGRGIPGTNGKGTSGNDTGGADDAPRDPR